MADLQDELHPATEVGRPDEPAESVLDEAVVVPPDPGLPLSAPDDSPLSRARALLAVHPVADGCSGLPGVLRDLPWYDLDLGDRAVEADLPRLRDGGVGAVFWSLRLPDDGDGGHAVVAALDQLDLARSVVAAHDEGLLPA
ncbi:membrane dipeptidase, partial [Streptomyces sp. SID7958]